MEIPVELDTTLRQLVILLETYDLLRLDLENKGGGAVEVRRVTEALSKTVGMKGKYRHHEVQLSDPETLRSLLRDLYEYKLNLQVRQMRTGLPAYYLCRIVDDLWHGYGFIVEDIYMSPGYPFDEDRLVSLMMHGHETCFLRLSGFRDQAAELIGDKESYQDESRKTDEMLYKAGRYVLRAAWHEDQKPALAACRVLPLAQFRDAIELLYLCLNADLCELRSVSTELIAFFTEVYENKAIGRLLNALSAVDGDSLSELSRSALRLYSRLSDAFRTFLRTEISWSRNRIEIPLFKILFANLSRLQQVRETLDSSLNVKTAARMLDRESGLIIDTLLAGIGSPRPVSRRAKKMTWPQGCE